VRTGPFALLLLLVAFAAAAQPERSKALRAEFVRLNPCPATGKATGACPGWQVDHREALICGGRDELANLQWLTIEEHKEKTRVEVKLCRSRTKV
jgi:hypothetical protein